MSNGATQSYHISERLTSLELIGGRDCDMIFAQKLPDLLIWGGASINKSLCLGGDATIAGDTLIGGNLVVLGETTINQETVIVTQDKFICLGNVVGMPSSDVTANGGGVIIQGPPNGSKTWLWYNDIGTNGGAWRSNQDIDLGSGRQSVLTATCGADDGIAGAAYRIEGDVVLDYTSLGVSVVNSSLQTVGTLYSGAIDNANPIVNTFPSGVGLTTVTTLRPHQFSTGDEVHISGSDSSPIIDGCHTITVLSPTQFRVSVGTTINGSTGLVYGPNFPINIGTSELSSGTHTIVCGNDLIVLNDAGVFTFKMNGTTEQLDVSNTTTQSYTQHINTTISGSFAGVQRGLQIDNAAESDNTTSKSIAVDIAQRYSGTNTAFTNMESTVQSIAERIVMSADTQAPLVKMTSRAIDITTNTANNRGSNVGVFAEAGGPSGSDDSIGVIGFTNADSGTFSVGVLGCANKTRTDVANDVALEVSMGIKTVGVYACNPLNGPNDWGLFVGGDSNLSGNVIVDGGGSLSVDLIQGATTPNIIESAASLLPAASAGCITLGSITQPWCEVHTDNLFVDALTLDTLFVNTIVAGPGSNGDVVIQGNLIPDADGVYTLGNATHKWLNGWFDDLNTGNLHVLGDTVFEGNVTFNGNDLNLYNLVLQGNLTVLQNTTLTELSVLNDLLVGGTLYGDNAYLLGNITTTNLFVTQDSTLNGNVNVNGKLTVNELCVLQDTMLAGNVSIGDDLIVTNDTTLNGNLIVSGANVDMNGNVNVGGTLTINDVVVSGNTVIGGNTVFGGDTVFSGDTVISGNVTIGCDVYLPSAMLQTVNASPTQAFNLPTLPNTSYMIAVKAIGMRDDSQSSALFRLNSAFCNDSFMLRKIGVDDVLKFNDVSAAAYDLTSEVSGNSIVVSIKGDVATIVNWDVCLSYVLFTA